MLAQRIRLEIVGRWAIIIRNGRWLALARAETSDEVIEKTKDKVLGTTGQIIVDSLGGA